MRGVSFNEFFDGVKDDSVALLERESGRRFDAAVVEGMNGVAIDANDAVAGDASARIDAKDDGHNR